MRVRTLLMIFVAGLLAFGSTASAQTTPTQDAYGGPAAEVDVLGETGEVAAPEEATAPSSDPAEANEPVSQQAEAPVTTPVESQGTLPFTGAEVGVLAAIGVLLLGTGVLLRRRVTA